MANLLRAQKRAIKAIKKAQKEQSGELDNLSDDEASDSDAEDKGEGKDDDDGGLGEETPERAICCSVKRVEHKAMQAALFSAGRSDQLAQYAMAPVARSQC